MSKAPAAFRTISEVSEELDVPKHVLRFWEMKFPQIKPMKRGGGRRYYRPEDVSLLKGICKLLHGDAYTIKGVQKILREQGAEAVKELGREDDIPAPTPVRAAPSRATPAAAHSTPKTATKKRGATAARTARSRPQATAQPAADADIMETLNRAIQELEACRSALLANSSQQTAARKSASRARTASSAR